jgi:hypothetical protein
LPFKGERVGRDVRILPRQSHKRTSSHTFAGTGFADERDALASVEIKIDALDDVLSYAILIRKPDIQPTGFQQFFAGRKSCGSRN